MLRYAKPVPGISKGAKQGRKAALKPEGRRPKPELLAEGHQPETEIRSKIHEYDVVGPTRHQGALEFQASTSPAFFGLRSAFGLRVYCAFAFIVIGSRSGTSTNPPPTNWVIFTSWLGWPSRMSFFWPTTRITSLSGLRYFLAAC